MILDYIKEDFVEYLHNILNKQCNRLKKYFQRKENIEGVERKMLSLD